MKVCRRCKEEKPLSEFHKNRCKVDGVSSYCRDCSAIITREARIKRPEVYRSIAFRTRAKNKEEINRKDRIRYHKNKEKYDVHQAVRVAVRLGILIRESCEICNEPKVEAHHDDYSKPLQVRWLCRSHHRKLHRDSGITIFST